MGKFSFGSKLVNRPLKRALVLGVAVFLIVSVLAARGVGRTAENALLDFCCRMKPLSPPPRDILIAGIDADSFRALNQPWPWPRRYHARLIDRLTKAGARLIVFDVFFGEPSNPEDDRLLIDAVKKSGKVVLAKVIESTQDPLFSRQIILNPLESLNAAAIGVGVSLLTPDADGVVRHFHLTLAGQKTLPGEVVRFLRPKLSLPDDFRGLIRYAGPPQHLESLSFSQILEEKDQVLKERVAGRVVLVGRTVEEGPFSQGQVDAFQTPYSRGSKAFMSGVEIEGNIIHDLLTGTWGREISPGWRTAMYLGFFLAFSLAAVYLAPGASLMVLAALGLVIFLGAWVSLCFFRLWLEPILLGAGLVGIYGVTLFNHHLSGLQEKRWLHQAFTHYVPQEVVDTLLAHPERLELGGMELEASVMFAELAGFKEISQNMAPRDLVNLLSDYFTPLTDIVLAHGGTLDKYMDSSLMAVWGAPLPQADHARRACLAALAMQRRIADDLRQRQARGQPFLGLSLGLHSGAVMAGNVGSKERFNYTIMGDTVNLAHRLQGLNRYYGTQLIVSDASRLQAGAGFFMRELDQVKVRGRKKPVTIFELVWVAPGETEPLWLSFFEEGRAAYCQRDWQNAVLHFEEVMRIKPEDGPAALYLRRCRRYLETPPPPNWKGVAMLDGR
uniref:Adenylate/guanylate cyclase domain-containing protein n=1 Tax=Desulfobacca acetoxidans TaxID=60893 RepID=A0A7V6DP98_9BACT